MIKLIIVRHGETDSNKKGTYLGWTDVDLNENGIRQAYIVREKLREIPVDAIFASPLKRARKTAEIINDYYGLTVQYSDELKERNFGIWDDLTYDEITERYPDDFKRWVEDVHYCIKEGESTAQAYKRAADFIDALVEHNNSGTYLIVTHLGCIRNLLAHLLGMNIEGAWKFRVNNCGITTVEVNDEKYAYLTGLNK